jgi:putative transposase
MILRKSRKTIRLQGYDYSQDGWYFVTFCVKNFEERLGIISEDGIFIPNELGIITENEWNETPHIRSNVELDIFQIMPNHFHAIVVIGSKENLPNIVGFPETGNPIAKFKSPVRTIGSIIRGFKGASTKKMRLITNNLEEKYGSIIITNISLETKMNCIVLEIILEIILRNGKMIKSILRSY